MGSVDVVDVDKFVEMFYPAKSQKNSGASQTGIIKVLLSNTLLEKKNLWPSVHKETSSNIRKTRRSVRSILSVFQNFLDLKAQKIF